MSDEQDTHVIKTKVKEHTIVLRNYITGADEEAIMQVTTAAMKTIVSGEGVNATSTTEVDAGMTTKLDRLKVQRFVQEFDGETNPTEVERLVFDLRREDFNLVRDYLNKLTADINPTPEKEAAKKKS